MNGNPKTLTYFLVALIIIVVIVAISLAFMAVYKNLPSLANVPLIGDGEISNCLAIKNTAIKNTCVESVAVARKDEKVCSNLTSAQIANEKNGGYMSCLMAVATINGREDLCKSKFTSNAQGWCLAQVAAKIKKPEICETLSVVSYKNQCYYSLATKNKLPQYCDKISEIIDKISDKSSVDWAGSKAKCQTASK
jgi:hypothetical protein